MIDAIDVTVDVDMPSQCISRFNRIRLSISNPKHAGFTLQEMRLAANVNAVIEGHHPQAWEAS